MELIEDLLLENRDCSVLCVTEHWKTAEQLGTYGIRGLNLVSSFCREMENRHGGSAIYLKDTLEFKVRQDINNVSVGFQGILR